jgi:hypothetical protein
MGWALQLDCCACMAAATCAVVPVTKGVGRWGRGGRSPVLAAEHLQKATSSL